VAPREAVDLVLGGGDRLGACDVEDERVEARRAELGEGLLVPAGRDDAVPGRVEVQGGGLADDWGRAGDEDGRL